MDFTYQTAEQIEESKRDAENRRKETESFLNSITVNNSSKKTTVVQTIVCPCCKNQVNALVQHSTLGRACASCIQSSQ